MCINPDEIEKHVTEKTSAILGVHVYGFPCNVEKIQKIAEFITPVPGGVGPMTIAMLMKNTLLAYQRYADR